MRDVTEDNVTEAVLATIDAKDNPRLKQILVSAITHLHAFARDVELTPDELFEAARFLTEAGKISGQKRHEFLLLSDKMAAYQEFEDRMTEASNRGDVAGYERLSAEQKALAVFNPFMTHSFVEDADFVEFHPRLLADFSTIEELGQRMLEELDR